MFVTGEEFGGVSRYRGVRYCLVTRIGMWKEDGLDGLVEPFLKSSAQRVVVLKRSRNTLAIATPWRCCHEQDAGTGEMIQDGTPRFGGRVVRFVDNDDVEQASWGLSSVLVVKGAD
jgi:hypothetical protein